MYSGKRELKRTWLSLIDQSHQQAWAARRGEGWIVHARGAAEASCAAPTAWTGGDVYSHGLCISNERDAHQNESGANKDLKGVHGLPPLGIS